MDILFLAHRIPFPPNKGDKIRSYHELERLARRHRVWCAYFVDDPSDMQYVADVQAMCHESLAIPLNRRFATMRGAVNLCIGGTITEGFYAKRAMTRCIQTWTLERRRPFDAVLAFSSGMAEHGLSAKACRRVLDFCDWDSLKWQEMARSGNPVRRWVYDLEGRRLARREQSWTAAYDACVVISEAEAAARPFTRFGQKIHVVGNGVEAGDEPNVSQPASPDTELRIGFAGQMDYGPNVQAARYFAEEVFPRVQREVPQARFEILGRHPTREVMKLGQRDRVDVIGEVSHMRDRLEGLSVSVAPMQCGRGVQNKVLEAMAAGRAVVLTSAAAEGIDADSGRDFVVENSTERMADEVVSLLRNPARRRQMGSNARRRVVANHAWDREMGRLEALLHRA